MTRGSEAMTQWIRTSNKRPDWAPYYLNIAHAVSMRSTCIRRTYGSIIVKNNIIVSTGYNGSSRGESNCIDLETCERQRMNVPAGERYELCVAVHAEANAIISATLDEMRGATIYITGRNHDGTPACGHPCLMCIRMIRNAQIGIIIYSDERGDTKSILVSSL